jgi:hypothetical protein
MTNLDFDARLKSALENLEVPYEPSTWAALEQRLPKPAAPDAVDKAVFSALENLEAPYQTQHWEMLAQRMAQRADNRRRLWWYKLAEAAVFLLLLLNLDGLLGTGKAARPQPAAPPPSDQPIAGKSARQHRSAAVAPSAAARTEQAPASAQMPGAAVFHPQNPQPDGHAPAAKSTDNQLFGEKSGFSLTFGVPAEPQPAPLAQAAGAASPDAAADAALPPAFAGLSALPGVPHSLLFLEKNTATHPVQPIVAQVASLPEKAPKPRRFYASTLASWEKNRVKTQGADLQITPGYGGGLAAGYRKGKWGAELGVAYSRREFSPRKEVKIVSGNINKGYYGAYVREVSADMVTVPVRATRRIARTGRLSAHVVAGLTANVATEKTYQNKTVFYPGFQPQPGTDPLPQPTALAQTGEGLLEGGSLAGNNYLSATAGLRLEHPISKRHTVFVEGTYNPALTRRGIGPKPAQINTLALSAGVMAGI